MQVLQDTFSISLPQQVKHLGKDGYDKLVEKTRHSWEKKALLELLGLSEDSIQKEKEKQAPVLNEDLISHVKRWNKAKDKRQIESNLKVLLEVKQSLKFPRSWSDYLSKEPLQEYIKWVVAITSKGEKVLLQQIIHQSEMKFIPTSSDISSYLYSQYQDEEHLSCTDFEMLLKHLEVELKKLHLASLRGDDELCEVNKSAKKKLAEVTFCLRNHLHKSEQKYKELFLTTMLLFCNYDATNEIFDSALDIARLEYFCQQLHPLYSKFLELEGSSAKSQAYLFHMVCKMYDDSKVSEEAIQHFQYLEKALQSDLESQVHVILKRHQLPSGYDWQELQKDLYSLVVEEIIFSKGGEQKLTDVLKSSVDGEFVSENTSSSMNIPPDSSHKLFSLLSAMDLKEMYPQKLSIQQSLVIQEESRGNMKSTSDAKLLPYYILQKIMMHDLNCRSMLFTDPMMYTSDYGSDSKSDNEGNSGTLTSKAASKIGSSFHPMDTLLSVIYCSDNFLRCRIFTKMSTCQMSLPFLLPDPITKEKPTLPLFAMRSIVKECKEKGQGSQEICLVEHKAPVFTFFRLSKTGKSKMLNDVIGTRHDFFFHWNCEGGSNPRHLVDGLAEICWYLPFGKPSDIFQCVIQFLNLRGNATNYPVEMEFLAEIASLSFILVSIKDLEEDKNFQVFEKLCKNTKLVLLLSDCNEQQKTKLMNAKYHFVDLQGKNKAEITKEIRHIVKKCVSSTKKHSISDCVEIAKSKYGILIDEDIEECRSGRRLAYDATKAFSTDSNFKSKMVPLQGPELWQNWAKQNKEQSRHKNSGAKNIVAYNEEKETEKLQIRKQQLQLIESNTSSLMTVFVTTLLQNQNHSKYFLSWLGYYLDQLSRKMLPDLHRKYYALRLQLQITQGMNDEGENVPQKAEKVNELKISLQELNKQLVQASFGLEHCFRELGQMYEAVMYVAERTNKPNELVQQTHHLPQVAAKLFISGFPLELMDGDAAHVPLKWVLAVLDEVKQLLGDVRVFVLSVLGIQSSGKSTLLNTVFGLQFTVSAGRCTRGAFMQLVPFEDSFKQKLKCDYLLVVDTEGLRAPEIDSEESIKHDNEIATFVIGLANLTIINIFGETPGDMDDILQTAVHALLRMKCVRLNPSIKFVHQNVRAVYMSYKTDTGRQKFLEKLDKVTRNAAKQEKVEDKYQSFSSVIKFDGKSDIYGFPCMWKGDPPMAPVNPGYCEAAQDLKCAIIEAVEAKKEISTLSQVHSLVEDLWQAVLADDFVFSFKNTAELSVYKELDAHYCQWSWEFQKEMIEWEGIARNKMQTSGDSAKLNELQRNMIKEGHSKAREVYDSLMKSIKILFENSEQRETFAQWQVNTELRFRELLSESETQVERFCTSIISKKQAGIEGVKMQEQCRNLFLEKVEELVHKTGEMMLTEEEQEDKFNQSWAGWLHELKDSTPEVYKVDVVFESSIERSLKTLFKDQVPTIIHKIYKKPLKKRQHYLKMPINKDDHMATRSKWGGLRTTTITEEDVVTAQRATERILASIQEYFDSKIESILYDEGIVYAALAKMKALISGSEPFQNFQFTTLHEIDLALTVAGYAFHRFEAMMEKLKMEQSPIEYVKRLKPSFLVEFKAKYSKSCKEKTTAKKFCSLLETPIHDEVISSLGVNIVQGMKGSDSCYLYSKGALKAKVLYDLGVKGDFSLYKDYLFNVSNSLRHWLKEYTLQYCRKCDSGTNKSCITVSANDIQRRLITKISTAVNDCTRNLEAVKPYGIRNWLDNFKTKVQAQIQLDMEAIEAFLTSEELPDSFDYKNFTAEVLEELRSVQQRIDKKFNDLDAATVNWVKEPWNLLHENLVGCCEQCPFCGEQCDLTNSNHSPNDHSVELHRPGCVGGWRSFETNEMILYICTSHVASDRKFLHNEKYYPYREYKTHFPNWHIPPDNSFTASCYWKWFVAKYTKELAEHYSMKTTAIPDGWNLEWEIVKKDLEKKYNVKL